MSLSTARRMHSFLAPHLEAYLRLKQMLGYTSFTKPYYAQDLDHYVLFFGIDSIEKLNEGAVLHWVYAIPKNKPRTKNHKIKFARGFFRYLIRVGAAQDNPADFRTLLKASLKNP
ncbi:MAG: hypothetical protein HY077_00020 [Elusimicrobia bacterium]|nr:hypothetical protein [Elusimicrobiota bacterium]